jgi:hypothetical protein
MYHSCMQHNYAGGASEVGNHRGQIVGGVLQVRRVIVAVMVKHRRPVVFPAVLPSPSRWWLSRPPAIVRRWDHSPHVFRG